jgi:3-phosphoglycerate kinase
MLKTIDQIPELNGKRVFLRTDFNVPMKDGQITDNNRIVESLPTIKFLLDKKAKIIIGCHLGRPDGQKTEDSSLAPVKAMLEELLGLKITLSPEVTGSRSLGLAGKLEAGQVLMLENLRWEKGEEAGDEQFARELAKLADLYINDAFAVSHRPHASVFAITKYLPSFAGMLLEKEISNLSKLVGQPPKPFVVILGGAKIADKIGVIDNLADSVDKFLIGGAMANTFLKALGKDVSESLFEAEAVDQAKIYLKKYNGKILIPTDQVTEQVKGGFSVEDIGEATIRKYAEIISLAKTVFWNGSLGYAEDPEFRAGTVKIAKIITDNRSCYSVIAGGDTVGAIAEAGLKDKFSFVSTGGGAALEFLAGKELPGIKVLEYNK